MGLNKILITIGPSTNNKNILKKIMNSKADGIRFNFSHSKISEHINTLSEILKLQNSKNKFISLLADLPGTKIRVLLPDTKKEVKKNSIYTLSYNKKTDFKINHNIINSITKNKHILIDDGKIEFKVIKKEKNTVYIKSLNTGIVLNKKGINLPGMNLHLEGLTENDISIVKQIIKYPFNYIAISFIKSADEIKKLKSILREHKREDINVIAKIERKEAIKNLDKIIKESDGVMVARGDLALDIGFENVALIQKKICRKCQIYNKLCIVATQMLESMIVSPSPNRSEITDITNAILDGADILMLSAETSIGAYPLKCISLMDKIIRTTAKIKNKNLDFAINQNDELFLKIAKSAVFLNNEISNSGIIIPTTSTNSVILLSKLNSKSKIFALNKNDLLLNKMNLYKTVIPLKIYNNNIDAMLTDALKIIKNKHKNIKNFIIIYRNLKTKEYLIKLILE